MGFIVSNVSSVHLYLSDVSHVCNFAQGHKRMSRERKKPKLHVIVKQRFWQQDNGWVEQRTLKMSAQSHLFKLQIRSVSWDSNGIALCDAISYKPPTFMLLLWPCTALRVLIEHRSHFTSIPGPKTWTKLRKKTFSVSSFFATAQCP